MPHPLPRGARRLLWWAMPLALLCAALLAPASVQAGTVTIEHGPDTPPVGGVYTDGYIHNHLTVTGSLTISTTGVTGGPNAIRVLQDAVIIWTTDSTLTLDAGSRVVISGTIQHDGPANGAGGVRLVTSGSANGVVVVAPGNQTEGVAVGSRHGLTRVQAGNLVLQGGSNGSEPSAQLGFHPGNQNATYTVTGVISVTVSQNVTATSGTDIFAFAQIGHGGFNGDATLSGNHHVEAGGDVTFQGGGDNSCAQLGNGGFDADGDYSGNHTLEAGGDVTFQAGLNDIAYALLGNGGFNSNGSHSGDHTVNAGGDATFQGGGTFAFAQLGNGGMDADNNHSGNHRLAAGGDVRFHAGGAYAYAQLGNGGHDAAGSHSGGHTLDAVGDVTFQGGGNNSYAQLGNGGSDAAGDHSGSLALTNTGSLTMTRGSRQDAYAMIGHGSDVRTDLSDQSSGSRAGEIRVRVGATAVFSGSDVGHLTSNGPISVTQGNTLIGVSQNDPFSSGTGQLLVTGAISSSFSSAPTANGGELRIYLPREDSQQIPTSATFNGETFVTANTIPPAQRAGFAPFGDGPYIPDYSFYLGGRPNVGVRKTAIPAGPLSPVQALTYTLSFSNTGNVTATGVVIRDSLPGALTFNSATLQPDAGVTITQTGNAPNLAWSVSSLGVGKGGRIRIVANVQNSAQVLGTTFTNTAIITATGDITLGNNEDSVARSVVAAATLIVTKTVVGDPPVGSWQFAGSSGIGNFGLVAAGGSKVITGLIPGAYAITETVKTGYTAAVACTTGASGASSVQVTLTPGATVGCTFTNTFEQTPVENGAVEGLVYTDANGNAQPDTGEGLAGVTVTLQSETGVAATALLTDTTDANGEYTFADLPVGDYTLSFAPPPGYASIDDVQVTVVAGQTAQAADRVARPEGPDVLGDLFLPVLQRSP